MSIAAPLRSEVRRRLSAQMTRRTLLTHGRNLDMWLGCGYPKSGTVWLCHLMASALEIPYPQNYESPIRMQSVIHGHWDYDARFPRTIYVHRDGRDVFTSLFFYLTRSGRPQRNPLGMALRKRRGHDIESVVAAGDRGHQMMRLFEMELERPTGAHVSWADHVRQWRGRPDVAVVSYEDLLRRPVETLGGAFEALDHPVGERLLQASVDVHDFSARTGRRPGDSAPESFRRSGTSGGWRQHFTPELARAFDDYAGDLLVDLGYETDRSWVSTVG